MNRLSFKILSWVLAYVFVPALFGVPLETVNIEGKRVGVYLGAFDMLNFGHAENIDIALEKLDYVIVVPRDIRPDKLRGNNFHVRNRMLEIQYFDHPRVLYPGPAFKFPAIWSIGRYLKQHNAVAVGMLGEDVITADRKFNQTIDLGFVTELLIFPRGSTNAADLPSEFRGLKVEIIDPARRKYSWVSSTGARNFLMNNTAFFESNYQPTEKELPIPTRLIEAIRRSQLYRAPMGYLCGILNALSGTVPVEL